MGWFGGDGVLSESKKRKLLEGRRKGNGYSYVRFDAPSSFSGILIPPRGFVKFKKFFNVTVQSPGGIGNNPPFEVIFQNSIYLPMNSVGDSQNGDPVLGYGAWSQFYRRYQVTAIKATVTFVCNSFTSADRPVRVTVVACLGSSNTIPSNVFKTLSPAEISGSLGSRTSSTKNGLDPAKVTYYVSSSEVFGQESLSSLEDTSSPFGTSPSSCWFVHVLFYYYNSGLTWPRGYASFDLTYYCTLSEPKVQVSPTGVMSCGSSVGVASFCEEDRLAAERDSRACELERQRVGDGCASSLAGGSRVGVGLGVVPSVVPSEFI